MPYYLIDDKQFLVLHTLHKLSIHVYKPKCMCKLIVPCDYYQYSSYEKMLANHFHFRLMTMLMKIF